MEPVCVSVCVSVCVWERGVGGTVMDYKGRLRPKGLYFLGWRVFFYRLEVYKKVVISPYQVYKKSSDCKSSSIA